MSFNINVLTDNQSKKVNKQVINVRNIIKANVTPSITVVDPKIIPIVKIDSNATKSINLESISFSNKLPALDQEAIEPYIEMAFASLESNLGVINSSRSVVRCFGQHEERIETIVSEYIGASNYEQIKEYLMKSDVLTGVQQNNRGAFRVVSFYQVEPKKDKRQKHSKHILNILFFDPFHLFIPSKFKDGEVLRSSEENRDFIYSKIKQYNRDIESHFPNLL